MAVTVKVLIPAKIAEAAQTTQYTATGVTTLIDKLTATNYSAVAATLSVNLVTPADTAGNQNLIVKTKTLQAGETYTFPEIVGAAVRRTVGLPIPFWVSRASVPVPRVNRAEALPWILSA